MSVTPKAQLEAVIVVQYSLPKLRVTGVKEWVELIENHGLNTNVHFNLLTCKIVDYIWAEFSDTTVARETLFKSADKGKFL